MILEIPHLIIGMEVNIIFYTKLERKREEIQALVHQIHFITD